MKKTASSADEHLVEQSHHSAKAQPATFRTAFWLWFDEFVPTQRRMREFDALMERLSYFRINRKFTREELNER